MPDPDPIAIENLLHKGALRHGVTVVHRDLVQAAADVARVGLAAALQVITVLKKVPPQA